MLFSCVNNFQNNPIQICCFNISQINYQKQYVKKCILVPKMVGPINVGIYVNINFKKFYIDANEQTTKHKDSNGCMYSPQMLTG